MGEWNHSSHAYLCEGVETPPSLGAVFARLSNELDETAYQQHMRSYFRSYLPQLGLLRLAGQRLEFAVQWPDPGEWERFLISVIDEV